MVPLGASRSVAKGRTARPKVASKGYLVKSKNSGMWDIVQSTTLPDIPIPQLTCSTCDKDNLTSEEIATIVENYQNGGSVRQLARVFWDAQSAMRFPACDILVTWASVIYPKPLDP